jgi:hypothetical protein
LPLVRRFSLSCPIGHRVGIWNEKWTSNLRSYKNCRVSILMTFGHHLTCDDVGFLISVSSMIFSNWCHFLRHPSFRGYNTAGRSLTPYSPITTFRQLTQLRGPVWRSECAQGPYGLTINTRPDTPRTATEGSVGARRHLPLPKQVRRSTRASPTLAVTAPSTLVVRPASDSSTGRPRGPVV